MDELAAGDARSHLAEVALKGLDPRSERSANPAWLNGAPRTAYVP
jgi:hypothetical protein